MLKVHGNTIFFCFFFLMLLKYVFFVSILDAIFRGTIFFAFEDSVWLVKKTWSVHCCSIPQFYCVSDHCWSGFALWGIFVLKKVVVINWLFPLASGPGYWTFLQFWQPKKHSDNFFWFVNGLMRCGMLRFMGVLSFWFFSSCFWNMSFFCLFLMRSFVVYIFSIFRTLCG